MNKKGFTLIELLAVIIILGILMIIAIPSVTKYISDSRKNAYVDTAKEIIGGARNIVNEGNLEMYDTDTTYYIESSCIKTENASKSPYGEFTKAYVVVTYDGKGYTYYWTSNDDAGQGIKNVVRIDKLDTDNIESDLKDSDISTLRGIDGRSKTIVISKQNNCQKEGANNAGPQINGETGEELNYVCVKATVLHTNICNRNDNNGCNANGKYGYNSTITYGTIPSGTPKAGDAYDCDVNNDGIFNPETERFYYVKNYGNESSLIYFTNIFGGSSITNSINYAYDFSNQNYHGPNTLYQYLPSKSTWNNSKLILPGTRQIVNQNGDSIASNLNIESFTYTDKAARLLTYQEVQSDCGSNVESSLNIDVCNYLFENIGYYIGSSSSYGYWLETPVDSHSFVFLIHGYHRRVMSSNPSDSSSFGVRPVITVKTSDIER